MRNHLLNNLFLGQPLEFGDGSNNLGHETKSHVHVFEDNICPGEHVQEIRGSIRTENGWCDTGKIHRRIVSPDVLEGIRRR
ncbi:ORF925 [White spot syndrome virus]|uniref:ORF925 n=1 Tax=White spot syndrome virus TaxID=342409 RepID=A0A2D3I607_9VIRU|nr:ORF925 [White spot syndrome virus]